MARAGRSTGRLGRRVVLFVGAVSLVVVSAVLAPNALAQPPLSVDDAENDVVYCDTTHPVPEMLLDVKIVEVSEAIERELGWDVTVVVSGFGNLSEEVSRHRDRDPLIDLRLEGSIGRVDVQVGYRDGQLLRRVVDVNGVDVPGATVLADETATGDALITATGLPLGPAPDWGLFTRYTLDEGAVDRFACDKAGDSLSADGTPQQPLVTTAVPATPTAVATVSPRPTTAAPTLPPPSEPATVAPGSVEPSVISPPPGGAGDFPWWLVVLLGAGAVIVVGAALSRRVLVSGGRQGVDRGIATTGDAGRAADAHFSDDRGPHLERPEEGEAESPADRSLAASHEESARRWEEIAKENQDWAERYREGHGPGCPGWVAWILGKCRCKEWAAWYKAQAEKNKLEAEIERLKAELMREKGL